MDEGVFAPSAHERIQPEEGWNGKVLKHSSDAALFVRFYERSLKREYQSQVENRPVYVTEEFVEIRFPGTNKTIVDRKVQKSDKMRWPEHYASFKMGKDSSKFNGTPLSVWPQIEVSQLATLNAMNVFTVEQLAALSDQVSSQIPMEGMQLRERAKAFLEASRDSERFARLTKEKAELEARLSRLEEMYASKPSAGVTGKKRGRPKKTVTGGSEASALSGSPSASVPEAPDLSGASALPSLGDVSDASANGDPSNGLD